jgi:hypothetical protein
MRLRKSKNAAQEELTVLVNEGYRYLVWLNADYVQKIGDKAFDPEQDNNVYSKAFESWANSQVIPALGAIFPTELERNFFITPQGARASLSFTGVDRRWAELKETAIVHIHALQKILEHSLDLYTDLPLQTRLYVEDIDSFHKVRDVNPSVVADFLRDGRLELSEDAIQMAFEQVLDVAFHKKDWGGEINDLYTANVIVNGARVATAFLLKGNGLKKKVMEIGDCGKNGDQLVRLIDSPASLFVVQFVGEISENIIRDVEGKIETLKTRGKPAYYCIMNGQDTARVLHAYGKLPDVLK